MDFSTGGFFYRGCVLILGDHLFLNCILFLGRRRLVNNGMLTNPDLALWKITIFNKSTTSMAMFNSFLYVYQWLATGFYFSQLLTTYLVPGRSQCSL